MEFEKIKDLMHTLDNSNLMDFELKLSDGFYIRMNKYSQKENRKEEIKEERNFGDKLCKKVNTKEDTYLEETKQTEKVIAKDEAKKEIPVGNIIKSPLVGTFYTSSSPKSPAFVKVGDKIKEGDTICIIEAMKVMNEIKTPFSGEVAEVFVSNEDMIEYNQPLFRII